MRKFVFISILISIAPVYISAQNNSIAMHYLFRSTNNAHGIGLQTSFDISKNFSLLPDIGYFFNKLIVESPSVQKITQSFTVNLNLAYNIRLNQVFVLSPIAGIGYFHEFKETCINKYDLGFPFHEHYNYKPFSLVLNIGTNVTCNFTKRFYGKAGYKLMLDSGVFIDFLNLDAGLGYLF